MPAAPLEAVMSGEVWATVYDQLAQLIQEHHTTLVFANTRRMVERVSRHLAERLGEADVAAHHGSLSKETRFDAEQRLKAGQLKVMVATASLELGIDIGDVELVCQLGTPRSISVFLQRVGRANHSVDGVPKGRIFPSSRDELVDCVALLDSVRRGELDRLHIPEHPLDVLSQQIVAEVAAREYGEDELFALMRRAYPYRNLSARISTPWCACWPKASAPSAAAAAPICIAMPSTSVLRARKGARLTAITCGGAIPDNADYQVDPRAGRHLRRHTQRGLRHREPGRRHLPARQHLVPHPARGSRPGARRGCQGPAAHHSVLAGRGAGAHRRTVAPRCRGCAPTSRRCCRR